VALFGNALHLVTADDARAREVVGRRLRAAGITVQRLERIEPSLEDTFVSIVEGSDAGRPAE